MEKQIKRVKKIAERKTAQTKELYILNKKLEERED
jgi:hypothetical protein